MNAATIDQVGVRAEERFTTEAQRHRGTENQKDFYPEDTWLGVESFLVFLVLCVSVSLW